VRSLAEPDDSGQAGQLSTPGGVPVDRLHVQVSYNETTTSVVFDGCAIADGFHLLPARLEPPPFIERRQRDSPGGRACQSSAPRKI
jgi:hypothetical protein